MTSIENRVHDLLHEAAERARPAPLLDRLDSRLPAVQRRRRATAAVAAALAVAVVGGVFSYAVQRPSVEPAQRPAQIFHLSGAVSMRPGTAWLVVTARDDTTNAPNPAYVAPAGSGSAVTVPPQDAPYSGQQRISADGTRLLRIPGIGDGPSPVVIDLTTGRSVVVKGAVAGNASRWRLFTELSHDNATLAEYWDDQVRLVDVSTGKTSTLARSTFNSLRDPAPSVGWAPDDTSLALSDRDGVVVVDRTGVQLAVHPGVRLVNGSQSWSPDGRSLLVYDDARGRFAVQPLDGGKATVLQRPPSAVQALGWAGSRVVWLAGEKGSQSLVTTDQQGADEQLWLRFDIGDLPVESVTWSRALSG